MNNIVNQLESLAIAKCREILESLLPKTGMVEELYEGVNTPFLPGFTQPHPFQRRIGRVAIVNRIRNGKLQMNKRVDIMGKGYRLQSNGQVIKMSPREIMIRKKAAKRAARKRQLEMAQIIRKRMLSLRKRDSQLGR